jgi:hypothetical protein
MTEADFMWRSHLFRRLFASPGASPDCFEFTGKFKTLIVNNIFGTNG